MVGNHHFGPFSVIWGALEGQIRSTSPKSELVLEIHPTNAYIKFEMNWKNTFLDNGRKPRYSKYGTP